jgi:murein peptide amidase A
MTRPNTWLHPVEALPFTHVSRHTVGLSYLGRPLTALYIRPKQEASFVEPMLKADAFVFAAIHGDEPLSAQVLHAWLQHLAKTGWLAQPTCNVLLLPVANPDGLHLNTRKNAAGVDLNRNFPTRNWEPSSTEDAYHGGNFPASEPETLVLCALLEQFQPKRILSLHTPYKVVNYDGPAQAMAQRFAHLCHYPVVESIGYATPGSFGTYAGIERNIATLTLELPEDSTPLPEVCNDVFPAMDQFLEG